MVLSLWKGCGNTLRAGQLTPMWNPCACRPCSTLQGGIVVEGYRAGFTPSRFYIPI